MTTTELTSNAMLYLTGNVDADFSLAARAGDYAADFDLGAAENAYRDAVQEALNKFRPTWTIHGDSIYSPIEDTQTLTDTERTELHELLELLDLDGILQKNTK